MKVLGIVVEYNPFHNGHIYHLEKSKTLTGSEAVVCVMSGNFIQRGEPALINKFARAEIALNNGADLIIELPHPFAMASAEAFAFGAVKLLESIGIVDCISFGSEHGNIETLRHISDILVNEPEEYRLELRKQLDKGLSFPVCRQKALSKYLQSNTRAFNRKPIESENSHWLSELLETSNNILGIEYLKALNKLNSPIKPYTIERVSNEYNSPVLTGPISSATAIRNSIFKARVSDRNELPEATIHSIPAHSRTILEREFAKGRGPNSIGRYENIIFALLRKMSIDQIRELPDISEGLEYRIKNVAETSGTFQELIDNISTKRYAQTRIQRILASLLTGVTKTDMELFMRHGGPQYAKILGFNSIGRQLLSQMKKKSCLPTIMKAADFKTSSNKLQTRMLEIESLSTDMYVLGYENPAFRKAGQEFTQNLVILKE